MVAPLGARTIEDSAIRRVLVEDLALQDAAVLEREMEYVPLCGVGHRIKPYDHSLCVEGLQAIPHATQAAMPTMQTPYTVERLSLRHLRHTRG
jgi:hypothetical protein